VSITTLDKVFSSASSTVDILGRKTWAFFRRPRPSFYHDLSIPFSLVIMAKNTSSNALRKIDVDAYSEDNFKEEEQTDANAAHKEPQSATLAQDVGHLVQSGKQAEALKAALAHAPVGANKSQQEKVIPVTKTLVRSAPKVTKLTLLSCTASFPRDLQRLLIVTSCDQRTLCRTPPCLWSCACS